MCVCVCVCVCVCAEAASLPIHDQLCANEVFFDLAIIILGDPKNREATEGKTEAGVLSLKQTLIY